MKLFSEISTFDYQQKLQLKKHIRYYVIRAEFFKMQQRRTALRTLIWLVPFLFLPGLTFLAVSSPQTCGPIAVLSNGTIVARSNLSSPDMPDCQSTNAKLTAGLIALLYLITVLPFVLGPLRLRRFIRGGISAWLMRVIKVMVLALTIALLLLLLGHQDVIQLPVTAQLAMSQLGQLLLLALASLIVLYLTIAVAAMIVAQLVKRIGADFHPDAIIVDSLVLALALSDYEPKWHDASFRKRIMSELEVVAASMENDLPRALRSGDSYTDVWLQETWRGKAAAIRSLKQWLSTPSHDTQERLTNKLATILWHTATNNWHALEFIEPQVLARPQRVARIMSTAKGVLVGAGPILFLFLLNETSLAVTGALGDYLKIGAIVWALITYISLLDPAYGIKLTALREAIDLLRGK